MPLEIDTINTSGNITSAGTVSGSNINIAATVTGTNTGDETGARVATLLHAASNKVNLLDADEVNGTDSANSFSLIRTTWAQVKAFLKTYFDTLYTLDIDVQSAIATPGSSTTSTTGAALPGATLTTTGTKTKKYQISFTGEFQNSSANDATNSIRFLIGGVVQTDYISSIFSTDATRPNGIGRTFTATVAPGVVILVQFYTSTGTITMNRGTLSIQGIA